MTVPATPTPDLARARQVEMILERVRTLPTLSPVAARLLAIGTIDEVLISDVVKIIESDPALSARILGLCRRADKGLGDRITTVKRAVLMLGIEAVRSAALSVSVYDLMTREDEQASEALDASMVSEHAEAESRNRRTESGGGERAFDRKGFWKHSIAVACAAELIAQNNPKLRVMPEEAFLAGLLHDVGKLVLELVLPRSYERVLALAHRRACDSGAVERTVLGLDHHTAGRRVAEHWGLPEPIQNVIWLHGQAWAALPEGPDRALTGIVTVAKAVCRRLHLGWSGDFGPVPDADRLWSDMGLKQGGPALIAGPLHVAIADRLKILGLDDTTPPGLLLESLANANRQLSDLNNALQERATLSVSQTKVLEAIEQFHALGGPRRTVAETMGVVAQSALRAFGPGYFGVLVQDEFAWRLVRLDASGVPVGAVMLEALPERLASALTALSHGAALNAGVLGLLPWLGKHVEAAGDKRKLRVMPIGVGGGGREEGPFALLLTDRDIGEGLAPGILRAVTATWSAALASAAERERSRRLHDQLVESNRAVADMQARLAEHEAMAKLGQTTAGAAHEMNNPLCVMSGHAQLLMRRLEDERDKAAAKAIADAAKELSSLISSLHLLSQTPECRPRPVAVRAVVDAAVAHARQRAGVETAVSVDIGVPTPTLDPELTEGVLTELMANALEACPAGPVSVEVVERDGCVEFVVEDAGPGLSEAARQHAFDPFFSDKRAGRGKGLGLTRAQRMAGAMGGEVRLVGLERGTRAVLRVPQ
ncbi:MAG TPA: HDOD domain-containing protein [Phycisphaerales bacterium]|nr:HDOD domain-containing protein [Phycisphaerales bacterium]